MEILKIADRKYGLEKMPPLKGASFGLKVSKTVSKLLSSEQAKKSLLALKSRFFSETEMAGERSLTNDSALTLGSAILGLLSNMDADEVSQIFHEAFQNDVYYESINLGNEANFEQHFRQYPGDLYPVAIWATYTHVKDFFTGLGDGLKALMPTSENDR